ncbi:MAG: DUF559 domain-containing protein [Campylobacteraceae bacterium]|nr:DUF559 domain-containing protein [Campylobacteraceae bacterium]
MPIYLTEENLAIILNELFPENDFIRDKSVPNSKNKRLRPDFRSDKMKIILEFDGDSHYCKAQRIKTDILKDNDYQSLGFKVFRIPYFVQMSSQLLKMIFDKDIDFEQKYPNGFIDKKVILPADFCELGINLFKKDLEKFSYCKSEIIKSLNTKIEEKSDVELVIPTSLNQII